MLLNKGGLQSFDILYLDLARHSAQSQHGGFSTRYMTIHKHYPQAHDNDIKGSCCGG